MKNILSIFLILAISIELVYAKPTLKLVRHVDTNSMMYIYEVETIQELSKTHRKNILDTQCKSKKILYHTQVFDSVIVKYWNKKVKLGKSFIIKNNDCATNSKDNS